MSRQVLNHLYCFPKRSWSTDIIDDEISVFLGTSLKFFPLSILSNDDTTFACDWCVHLFFWITQYIIDTRNTHSSLWTHACKSLPVGASSKTRPGNPQDWQSHYRRLAIDENVAYHQKSFFREVGRQYLVE
jgi:hypothetical protein